MGAICSFTIRGPGETGKMAILHILPTAILAAAVTIGGGMIDTGETGRPSEAKVAFADAPYGVDPIVTGPTSASFKAQQEIAGCDRAEWPDVPVACYPE